MKRINNIIFGLLVLGGVVAVTFLYFTYSSGQDVVPKKDPVSIAEPQKNTEQTTVIAFGDSLTAGYGLPLYESYPSQLEKLLQEKGLSVRVINSGISGETTKGNFERAQFIRNQNPRMVILGIGGNDALRSLPIEETKKNIESTLTVLLSGENPPKVLLLRMQAPLNSGVEYKKEFDAMYPFFASKYSLPLVPFIVPEVSLNKTYLQNDGIHPTRDGYAILVTKYVFPAVTQALTEK